MAAAGIRPPSQEMLEKAEVTAAFLKAVSHPARLVILCRLAEGPAYVSDLEEMLEMPQAMVSKQLARLRDEGLVTNSRDGRNISYALAEERTGRVMSVLHKEFCA